MTPQPRREPAERFAKMDDDALFARPARGAPRSPVSAYQIVADRIIAAAQRDGILPWQKPWKAADRGPIVPGMVPPWWPRNLESGRPYNGMNVWLTLAAGYESPYWVTQAGCIRLGGTVQRSQWKKYTVVTYWKKLLTKDKATGEPKSVLLLKWYQIWNAEQCEGLRLPEARALKIEPETVTFTPIEMAEAIVAGYANGPTVEHRYGDRASYSPLFDIVRMPTRAQFERAEGYYGTLFHELTHSTGHKSRLDREFGPTFGDEKYSQEELVAEMGAAFLAAESGVTDDSLVDQSAAYVLHWCDAIRSDPKILIHAAGKASKAVAHILGRIPADASEEKESEAVPA